MTATSRATPPVSEPTRRWIVAVAGLRYAAKALVYGVIGVIALLAAAHGRGQATGSRGVAAILSQRFGGWLLGGLAVGLAAYALWRLVQAVIDADHRGSNLRGLTARVGVALIGLAYAGLAYSAARLFFGMRAETSDDRQAQSWTALLLTQPYGPWLVAAAGIVVVILAVHEAYVAVKANFVEKLNLEQTSRGTRTLIVRCAQVGHLARAVVFAVIGAFLIQAALHSDAREARGLGGALRALEQQPYGNWLLAAVAVGLLAYAAYLLLLIIYRRILGA